MEKLPLISMSALLNTESRAVGGCHCLSERWLFVGSQLWGAWITVAADRPSANSSCCLFPPTETPPTDHRAAGPPVVAHQDRLDYPGASSVSRKIRLT